MLRMSESVRQNTTQDGAILLDVHRGQMLSINGTGARIVELVLGGRDESQIVDEISGAYGVDQEVVRRDVDAFLQELRNHHVFQASDEAQGLDQPGGSR